MGRSVVLPELADLLDLPSAHRLGLLFVTDVGREIMGERPTADGCAAELEVMAAMHFRSGKAVGNRRARTQQLAQQIKHWHRPRGETVAA